MNIMTEEIFARIPNEFKNQNCFAQKTVEVDAKIIFDKLCEEARKAIENTPDMRAFFEHHILLRDNLAEALASRIAALLETRELPESKLYKLFLNNLADNEKILDTISNDFVAVLDRDPVCQRYLDAFCYFKGFHAIINHRLANSFWKQGKKDMSLFLQSLASKRFAADIHPAVKMGKGITIDHCTGIVIGETAVIDDWVWILHGVTLGGMGKERKDRHPKVRCGVLIGAGATVLGNIEIGKCSKIAAGSVVLQSVPANKTVAGVPAQIVGYSKCGSDT